MVLFSDLVGYLKNNDVVAFDSNFQKCNKPVANIHQNLIVSMWLMLQKNKKNNNSRVFANKSCIKCILNSWHEITKTAGWSFLAKRHRELSLPLRCSLTAFSAVVAEFAELQALWGNYYKCWYLIFTWGCEGYYTNLPEGYWLKLS